MDSVTTLLSDEVDDDQVDSLHDVVVELSPTCVYTDDSVAATEAASLFVESCFAPRSTTSCAAVIADHQLMSTTSATPIPVCTFCNKLFRDKSDLNRHIRTHTGEKPFVCPQCFAAFTRQDTLKKHISTKHDPVELS